MKHLQKKLLPICIMLICGTTSVSTVVAAERHSANTAPVSAKTNKAGVSYSKRLINAKNKTPSKVRQPGMTTQARKNTVRSAFKIANTATSTVRSRTIDTTNHERTPVYDLPDVSRNNPRDPNGPIDGNDYRPPVAEDMQTPMPEGLDTNKLSHWVGDPRDRPDGMSEEDYRDRNRSSDYRARDMNTREGQLTMIKFGDENGHVPGEHYGKPAPEGNDSGNESGGGDAENGDIKLGEGEDVWVDEDELDADMPAYERIKPDSDPEGDDPDEMRGRMASEQRVITGGVRTGQGPINPVQTSAGQGKRKPGEWLPGETIREHGQRVTSGTPLPEDGGPDESSNAGSSLALNKERFNRGMVAKPTPDAGQGGGPINPGPNAVQGQVNLSNFGLAASPDPEAGESGGTVPPRPEM